MRIIASVNQKGGVGKTTICANLACALAEKGKRVLAIDLDPQGHLGQSFGYFQNRLAGIDAVFSGTQPLNSVINQLGNHLSFVSAGPRLQALESTPKGKGRGLLLKKAIVSQLGEQFDVVLLDCPPSSGFLVVNALAVANELLVPVTPDFFGMSGLSMLLATVENFEQVLGQYQRKWFVVSRKQHRRLTKDVLSKLTHYFGDDLVTTHITERAVLAECPSFGQPVVRYAPHSSSASEFMALANHLLQQEDASHDKKNAGQREPIGA